MSYRRLLLTAAATSLALAACNQKPAAPVTGAPIASLPLAQAAPPPEVVAPAADQLPPAPPLRRAARPRPIYSYVDAAYELGDAFADSPPDYTVDYEGERPWVWRSGGGEYRVVEQTPYGIREYFYRGDSNYPFLIRDTDYSYAYDNGELVGVYDGYGRPYANYGPSQIDYASRYLYRARRLYDAALHQQRQAAYAADWREHRDVILAPQRQWAAEQQRNDDWRRWRDQRGSEARAQQRQIAFDQERAQRQAYSARLAPVIAAAAAPQRPGPQAEARRGFDGQARQQQVQAQDQARAQGDAQRSQDAQRQQAEIARGQFTARDQRGQAEAARRVQEAAQAQGRDQQRLQAEAQARALNDAGRQQRIQLEAQRGQAEFQARARNDAQRQQQVQARDQQRVQADAQRAQRDAGRQQVQQAQAQQAQARDQQRAQAEAQRAQRDAGRQQAQAAQAAQAQAQARDQQRAQAEAQRTQRDAGRQQAQQAQQVQAAQAQARDQQRAQAEAQRAQRDAGRQQAEQAQAARAAQAQQ
nr:hypothetical protein [Phenylobacterium sp.]